jgi:amidophosphoribosyltransferase
MSLDEIAVKIGVDSLGYLSVESVNKIAEGAHCTFCDACFTGKYPIPEPASHPKSKFEHKISENI